MSRFGQSSLGLKLWPTGRIQPFPEYWMDRTLSSPMAVETVRKAVFASWASRVAATVSNAVSSRQTLLAIIPPSMLVSLVALDTIARDSCQRTLCYIGAHHEKGYFYCASWRYGCIFRAGLVS